MQIRIHPELKSWGQLNGVAYPPPFPAINQISHLKVRNIVYKHPGRIEFILSYGQKRCGFVKQFKDEAFARALHESRYECIGKSLGAIGDINIKYRLPQVTSG
jgi:hypothetical protein